VWTQLVIYLSVFFVRRAHFWFATVHEVLHADWQDAWHSPQPAPTARLIKDADLLRVFTFFMSIPSLSIIFY